MKAAILILFSFFTPLSGYSVVTEDTLISAGNSLKTADTVYYFHENFNDGNFTHNPTWEVTAVRMCAPDPPKLSVVDGVLSISQQNARTCGNWAHISIHPDIPVSENTKIQFDVRPSFSSVEEGSGYKNEEFPIMIRLRLLNQMGEYLSIWFCYNYRGGKSYFYKDNVKLVFPNCTRNKWIRNEVFRLRNFFPDAKSIIELQVASAGWDYQGYADNIKIYNEKDLSGIGFHFSKEPERGEIDVANKSRHLKAIAGYKENLRLADLGGDMKARALWLNMIGETYFLLDMPDSAIWCLKRCIKTENNSKALKPFIQEYSIKSLNTLAQIFSFKSQYDSALNVLDKLYAIYIQGNDTSQITQVLNEKAGLFRLIGENNRAESCLIEIINLEASKAQKPFTAKAFQKLGDIFLSDSLYQQALENYHKALQICKKSGDLNSTAMLLFDIGNTNLITGNYDAAIEDLNNCLEIAKMRNLESLLSDVYLKFSEIYDLKGQTEIALSYYKRYSNAQNILFNKEKNRELAEQYVLYETQNKNREIEILKQENQIKELNIRQKSVTNTVSISVAGLILIIVFVVYGRYRSKQKANKLLIEKNKLINSQKEEIERKVKENEIMLRELHHRVKNNLQTIYSMLVIQSRKLKDPEAKAIIEPNIHRIWAMALIHHKLYRDENLTRINLIQYVDELIANVLRTSQNTASEIRIIQEIDTETMDADVAISLGLIINELLCNAIKHAFHNTPDPTFNLTIHKISENKFRMVVKDNGPGIPDRYIADHSNTFGLELIGLLVTQLKGEMKIENKSGTCYTFVLKHG